jgi:hypothetical protein
MTRGRRSTFPAAVSSNARAPQVALAMGLKVSDLCHDRPANGHYTRGSRCAERPPLDHAFAAEHLRMEATVLILLAEKVRPALAAEEQKRIDLLLRRCDMIVEQAGGGREPLELARLRGRKAAA